MTNETLLMSEFFLSVKADVDEQTQALQEEVSRKLSGAGYRRAAALESIFPGMAVRATPTQDRVTQDDIAYSVWLIGELKGRLEAQRAHRSLQEVTALANTYSFTTHVQIVSALRAEMAILAFAMENFNRGQKSNLMRDLEARTKPSSQSAPRKEGVA
jgi:hypothetical protein